MGLYTALMIAGTERPVYGQTGVWITVANTPVSSAMTMTGILVASGSDQQIFNSGAANVCAIDGGAIQYVSNGGVASGCQFGGYQYIATGGLASNCTFSGGGRQYCQPYGTVSGAVVDSGSFAVAYAYGNVTDVSIVAANAYAVLSSGAVGNNLSLTAGSITIAEGATVSKIVNNGGTVKNSGIVSSLTCSSGSTFNYANGQLIDPVFYQNTNGYVQAPGGVVSNATLSGARLFVQDSGAQILGGSANGLGVAAVAILYLYNGAYASSFATVSRGQIRVSSGGTAYNPLILSDGECVVYTGGYVSNIYLSGRSVDVSAGAVADGCQLIQGLFRVWGIASSVVVESGASLYVYSGGSALAVTSNTGAVVSVFEGGYIGYVTP